MEFGIREPKEETERIYMVSWPLYGDKTGKPRLTKEMKKQGYPIDYGNKKQYFFRITKNQYKALTKKYFEADALLLDVSVPFTFFLPKGQEDW